MTNDQMFYLFALAPVALVGITAGFFVSRFLCRKDKRLAGLTLLLLPGMAFFFYFAVLLTSGIIGAAAKYIMVYTFMFVPPFWLGGIAALFFTKSAPKK